jgi:hypothetical protein
MPPDDELVWASCLVCRRIVPVENALDCPGPLVPHLRPVGTVGQGSVLCESYRPPRWLFQ